MKDTTQILYEKHHTEERPEDFSILKNERGSLFKKIIGTGKKVLDLGCRNGVLTNFFIEGNEVTGADIDTIALEKASELGIKTIHLDLNGEWQELKGKTFDVVVLAETLEHLYYPERVIEKVKAVIKKDCVFIGSVPNAFSLKNRIRLLLGQKEHTSLHDPTHINHFSHKELETLLKKHYKHVEIVPLGTYASWDRFWKGMFSFDLVFVCSEKIERQK